MRLDRSNVNDRHGQKPPNKIKYKCTQQTEPDQTVEVRGYETKPTVDREPEEVRPRNWQFRSVYPLAIATSLLDPIPTADLNTNTTNTPTLLLQLLPSIWALCGPRSTIVGAATTKYLQKFISQPFQARFASFFLLAPPLPLPRPPPQASLTIPRRRSI